jgi:hypothetical protein
VSRRCLDARFCPRSLSLVGSLVTVAAVSDRPTGFGDPLPGLTHSQKLDFDAGFDEFIDVETIDDGLGPVFNEASCATCHVGPGTAIGGSNDRLETRFGKITNGQFDPMTDAGGSLIQDHSIGLVVGHEYKPETVPADATIVARRRTTSLFGLGLVDAVPDVDFISPRAKRFAMTEPRAASAWWLIRFTVALQSASLDGRPRFPA